MMQQGIVDGSADDAGVFFIDKLNTKNRIVPKKQASSTGKGIPLGSIRS